MNAAQFSSSVERSPKIRHRMALLPGGATKQWLGLVLNVCYWLKADMLNALTNVGF
jgi:hypothetical protein